MFHQERRTKVAQAGQLQFFQILAKIGTGKGNCSRGGSVLGGLFCWGRLFCWQ